MEMYTTGYVEMYDNKKRKERRKGSRTCFLCACSQIGNNIDCCVLCKHQTKRKWNNNVMAITIHMYSAQII